MTTVFFADLSHTTITISNDSFPLNVGMVAAYARKYYPDLDVHIFKFPEELYQALEKRRPDILAMSNYPWNNHINGAFMRYAKQRWPGIMTVMGGPFISYRPVDQHKFMLRHSDALDFYTMFEGETSFKEVLDRAYEHDFNVERMKRNFVKGSLFLEGDNLCSFLPFERNRALEDYPSPYLTGLFDRFFAEKLSPMIETHRGCPYTCTFCHEGHRTYAKVNRFETSRVAAELDYIADHIQPHSTALLIADPNFGMFERDIDVARKIRDINDRTGYPSIVFSTSAKNAKQNLIEISKVMRGIAMPIWMSVQSMNEKVLENIQRKNISIDQMVAVQQELVANQQQGQSEIIMCLPGETFETHLESLVDLMRLKMDFIATYQLMMLDGSEMKTNFEELNQYGMVQKYRVLPRSFTDLPDVGKSIETETIVVATNTFSFDDYLLARKLHLIMSIYYNGGPFKGFFKLAHELGMDLKAFMFDLLQRFATSPEFSALLEAFMHDTKRELFESEEDIQRYYQEEENFRRLVEGVDGANLLQKYTSLSYLEHAQGLVNLVTAAALERVRGNTEAESMVEDVSRYYRLSFQNFLATDRAQTCDRGRFSYDVAGWLTSPLERPLTEFGNTSPTEVEFYTPAEQYRLVENLLDSFGRTAQAFGKVMTRLWIVDMLRKPRSAA